MRELYGPISDRLRALFDRDDPVWHPQRGTEPPRPVPPAADGHQLSKPDRRRR